MNECMCASTQQASSSLIQSSISCLDAAAANNWHLI